MGTSEFRNVLARDIEEAKEVAGIGDGGVDGASILGVWYTTDGSLLVPVLGTNVVVH